MNLAVYPTLRFGQKPVISSNANIPTERNLGGGNVIPEWHSAEKPGFYSSKGPRAQSEGWDRLRSTMFDRISDSIRQPSNLSGDAVFLIGYFVGTDDDAVRWQSAMGLKELADHGASNADYCFRYIQPKLKEMFLAKIQQASTPHNLSGMDFKLLKYDKQEIAQAVIEKFLTKRATNLPLFGFEAQALGKILTGCLSDKAS
jgi:hypothetical protein